jgi:hypothetical protein
MMSEGRTIAATPASYKTGGLVKKGGLAKVEKGEVVLPPGLADALTEAKTRKPKPRLEVHASMESPIDAGGAHDWRKEAIKRLEDECEAAQDQLDDWDDASVGRQARKSLQAELAVKKARIMEHKASMKRGRGGIY